MTRSNAQKVVLLLPPGEHHELGLLFYNYAFRQRGCHTLYLGPSVPAEGLDSVLESYRPEVLVAGAALGGDPLDFEKYVVQLRAWLPGTKIYGTGAGTVPGLLTVQELRNMLNLSQAQTS